MGDSALATNHGGSSEKAKRLCPLKMEKLLLEQAFHRFLDERDILKCPSDYPIPYELCKDVSQIDWMPYIGLMVSGDLQETINLLNEWRQRLMDWEVWLKVLDKYEGNDSWTVRLHVVESVVFWCMMQPSSTRDRIGVITTSTIHQANLHTDSGYKDHLDQDLKPGSYLSRSGCEKQLQRIGKKWAAYPTFALALKKIDSPEYRAITRNFRNLASHGIAPCFEQGLTNFVVRSIAPRSELVKQDDGTYQLVEDTHKQVVRYGFGGPSPLSLRAMHGANEKEFALALATFKAYQELLRELLLVPKEAIRF